MVTSTRTATAFNSSVEYPIISKPTVPGVRMNGTSTSSALDWLSTKRLAKSGTGPMMTNGPNPMKITPKPGSGKTLLENLNIGLRLSRMARLTLFGLPSMLMAQPRTSINTPPGGAANTNNSGPTLMGPGKDIKLLKNPAQRETTGSMNGTVLTDLTSRRNTRMMMV